MTHQNEYIHFGGKDAFGYAFAYSLWFQSYKSQEVGFYERFSPLQSPKVTKAVLLRNKELKA